MIKLYLDHCCYNRPFDSQEDAIIIAETNAKMFIQSLILYNVVEMAYSSVSLQENADNPFEENRRSILAFIHENAKYYIAGENNESAITMTEEIMRSGLKLKDAAHLACAILAKCDYPITTDKRFLRHRDERIKIVNPVDFVRFWEEMQWTAMRRPPR